MIFWIRPVYKVDGNRETLLSIAVCKTNGPPLIDEQIVEHFPVDTPGTDITKYVEEFWPGVRTSWGNTIQIKGAIT